MLVGGSPLAVMRLSERGAALIGRLRAGESGPWSGGEQHLIDRLLDRGMLLPTPGLDSRVGGPGIEEVTVVVPTFGRADELDRCLVALRADPNGGGSRIVVVDDGFADGLAVAAVANRWEADLVRLEENAGPAAARNAGLALVDSRLVAFVDSDVEVRPGWLAWVVRWFEDERAALVAPRVIARGRDDALGRFEIARSPLDLGPRPSLVRARSRVAYVPAAALVARTDAVRAVGGFDTSLRLGEDVDLCWRLAESGRRCWYVGDEAVVGHDVRGSVAAAARQRFGYGTSAAGLDARHPGSVAPLATSGWSLAVWAAVAGGHPVVGVGLAGATAAALVRRLDQLEPGAAAGLALRGHLGAGELIGRALVRPWWPVTLLASTLSRRLRRVAVVAAVVPPLLEWRRRRPRLDPVTWTVLSLGDDVAYSAGVWWGAWRARSGRALLPQIRSWPGRRER